MCYMWFTKQTDLKKGAGGELLGGNYYDMIQAVSKFCFLCVKCIVIRRLFSNDCDLEGLANQNFKVY